MAVCAFPARRARGVRSAELPGCSRTEPVCSEGKRGVRCAPREVYLPPLTTETRFGVVKLLRHRSRFVRQRSDEAARTVRSGHAAVPPGQATSKRQPSPARGEPRETGLLGVALATFSVRCSALRGRLTRLADITSAALSIRAVNAARDAATFEPGPAGASAHLGEQRDDALAETGSYRVAQSGRSPDQRRVHDDPSLLGMPFRRAPRRRLSSSPRRCSASP
jgi:hypothetical protein